jgi:hypothetical protein
VLLPRLENCRARSDTSGSQSEIILVLSPFAVASGKSQLCHRAAQRAHVPDARGSKPEGEFDVCEGLLGVTSADGDTSHVSRASILGNRLRRGRRVLGTY